MHHICFSCQSRCITYSFEVRVTQAKSCVSFKRHKIQNTECYTKYRISHKIQNISANSEVVFVFRMTKLSQNSLIRKQCQVKCRHSQAAHIFFVFCSETEIEEKETSGEVSEFFRFWNKNLKIVFATCAEQKTSSRSIYFTLVYFTLI